MRVMKQKILVTGGAGFLGSHLCTALVHQGHEVLCLDNFYTGRKANIRSLLSHANFEVIRHDICEAISLEVDAIYHLACPASPPHYQKDPIQTTKTSIFGMLNVLELARRLKIPVLFSSTSEVYGDPVVHPQTEDYWGHVNPIGIRACYDEGKRCAETFCMDYHRQYGVDIKIARIFNTYGPNMCPQDGRVISNFIMQALQNQPLTIYGDGNQTRSFCYVDDNIAGLMKLMQSESIHQPVNIGNPIEYTMKEIAEKIIALTGSQSKISYLPLPQDDPKQRKPDITRARTLLNWEPTISLETGIKQTTQYFKQYLNTKHNHEVVA